MNNRIICQNCKCNLENASNFCPNCGAPLNSPVSFPPPSSVRETISFSIAGRELSFSDEVIEYNKLRVRFFTKASDLEMDYIAFYKNRKHCFQDLFDIEIPEVFSKAVLALKFAVNILMEYGIDDIDENELAELISRRYTLQEHLSPIFTSVEKIEDYANELAGIRSTARSGRSYWQGGGFGVGGAISGALTAGALNLGTNMFRGIGDAIVDSNDRSKISKLKSTLANSERTFQCLHDAVFRYCIESFYCVKEILTRKHLIPSVFFDSKRAKARANNYIEMYEQSDKSVDAYEKVVDVLCESIQASPYTVSTYCNLYSILADEKKSIHALAKYFGLSRDYRKQLVSLDQDRLNSIAELPSGTIKEVDFKITSYRQLAEDNPFIDISQQLSSLKELRNHLQQNERDKQNTQSIEEMIRSIRTPLIEAISNSDINHLWSAAQSGNVFAKYELKVYYYKLAKPLFHDMTTELDRVLSDIHIRAKQGSDFARYLSLFLDYTAIRNAAWYCTQDYRKETLQKLYLSMKELAKSGDIMAISDIGYWMNAYYFCSDNKGFQYLLLAAKKCEPFALYHLGMCYKEGKWGAPKDTNKAVCYLKLACEFDLPEANSALDSVLNPSASTSGGCFITSAVCRSLGKDDDCYELNSFRYFRDNWLRKCKDGDALIKEYYLIAPRIVANIDSQYNCEEIYRRIWDTYLTKCLYAIEHGDHSRCKELYCQMVFDLKRKYLLS